MTSLISRASWRAPRPERDRGPKQGALAAPLHLEAEPASEAFAAPFLAEPAEPANQHRVIGEGGGLVDDPVQQLVVAGGRDAEPFADDALLRAAVLPPFTLEIEDAAGALVELHRVIPRLPRGVHAAHELRLTTLFEGASTRVGGFQSDPGPPDVE